MTYNLLKYPSLLKDHSFLSDTDQSAREIYLKLWGTDDSPDVMYSFWNTYKLQYMLTEGRYLSRKTDKIDPLFLERNQPLKDFKSVYHRIGNMIIVPKGFNTGRSLPTGDYWGVSQENIEKCLGDVIAKQWRQRFLLPKLEVEKLAIEKELMTIFFKTSRYSAFQKFEKALSDEKRRQILTCNEAFMIQTTQAIKDRTQRMILKLNGENE